MCTVRTQVTLRCVYALWTFFLITDCLVPNLRSCHYILRKLIVKQQGKSELLSNKMYVPEIKWVTHFDASSLDLSVCQYGKSAWPQSEKYWSWCKDWYIQIPTAPGPRGSQWGPLGHIRRIKYWWLDLSRALCSAGLFLQKSDRGRLKSFTDQVRPALG